MEEGFDLNWPALYSAEVSVDQCVQLPLYVLSGLAGADLVWFDSASPLTQRTLYLVAPELYVERGFADAGTVPKSQSLFSLSLAPAHLSSNFENRSRSLADSEPCPPSTFRGMIIPLSSSARTSSTRPH